MTIISTQETEHLLIFKITIDNNVVTGYVPKELFCIINKITLQYSDDGELLPLYDSFLEKYMTMFNIDYVDGKFWSPNILQSHSEYFLKFTEREKYVKPQDKPDYEIKRTIRRMSYDNQFKSLHIDLASISSFKHSYLNHVIKIVDIEGGVELSDAKYYTDKPDLKKQICEYLAKELGYKAWHYGDIKTKIQIFNDNKLLENY